MQALFTRAEEIGFAGALAALKSKLPLAPMPTLSLETSQARGFARVDGGPVVRVGDRLSIFDSRITHWLETAFRDLQVAQPGRHLSAAADGRRDLRGIGLSARGPADRSALRGAK